jgi:hypothetical protein
MKVVLRNGLFDNDRNLGVLGGIAGDQDQIRTFVGGR